ncbi:malto-oligosyltrehalose trehalohydrolase [Brachybacterium sp. EE-P12]|uniref:Malto-oligosyltrehalose trehalohydrolase n=1 Tax=Candidatus Brachybacterium intestinipullorum TaxID=2838512 RepID=A0A9D2TJ05_9MICO|nr:malto-oligosyltrehalose trehalohydrolase [Brachybacterium sp. EE-P12]HJC70573.1 malto-oligosyltrehalose trehalohydrolase [Candidatus Brachybacterium intestinipullorum]
MTRPAQSHPPRDASSAAPTGRPAPPIPPTPLGDRDRYRVWAPSARAVRIRIDGVEHPMDAAGGGWFELADPAPVPGARYAFRLDDAEPWLPDPRSLSQPDGVHGASEVVDPAALAPSGRWPGRDLRGAVLYELHVGTFAPGPDGAGGTLDSAIEHLDELVDLGVDAVELMPLATFPGERGWGYDGVGLYAVHAAYGGPAALARFVRAAHDRGLAVVLDVVHNHLGPSGNYLGRFGPYFTAEHETPWGEAVNLDQPGSRQVRDFLLGSARQWLVELGLDGLRLDAVHELKDDSSPHLLAELADAVGAWEEETGRPLALIAESDRNQPSTVTPTAAGGLGMDMQWADDVHHAVHAWITGERTGYYGDFGDTEVLARVLPGIFLHAGTWSSFRGQVWGAPVDPSSPDYDGHSFVTFLQDHDQVGNRAAGDRIHHGIAPGAHAAAIALILLGPGTPMLFQGEEWAASTPFAFFTDHDEELGPLVSAGRVEEFAAMGWAEEVPDPQARATFVGSQLRWQERTEGEHARMLQWYRELIALRRAHAELGAGDLAATGVEVLCEDAVLMRRGELAVLAHRGPDALVLEAGRVLRASELLAGFGAPGHGEDGTVRLDGPGAAVLRGAEVSG